jgi:hypothetical protein
MKNLHLISTNKPSRLTLNKKGLFLQKYIYENEISKSFGLKNQHIYITNDEKIKEGDWYLLSNSNNLLIKCVNNDIIKAHPPTIDERKKIILTTDQDLINDGVQAIDDEFLQWFVKNLTCEYVTTYDGLLGEPRIWKKYIVIPKEKAKQECLHQESSFRGYYKDGCYTFWVCNKIVVEEPNQKKLKKRLKEWFKQFKKR